jgi:hypothetical protein
MSRLAGHAEQLTSPGTHAKQIDRFTRNHTHPLPQGV